MARPNHFALAALGLGLFFVVASQGEGPVPAADVAKLVNLEIKHIQTELAKPKFLKKGQKRVRTAAFMIAVYAQNAKDNAPAMATLRDQALKVMKAAQTGKADETKKLAATLSPDIKHDPASKVAPVALEKQLDLDTLMGIFSTDQKGGFGLEPALEGLVDAKGLDAAELKNTELLGLKISMMARVAQAYAPESDQGKKTKKLWEELAAEMQTEANKLAATAHAKKSAEVSKIANRLTGTCTKCHDIFR